MKKYFLEDSRYDTGMFFQEPSSVRVYQGYPKTYHNSLATRFPTRLYVRARPRGKSQGFFNTCPCVLNSICVQPACHAARLVHSPAAARALVRSFRPAATHGLVLLFLICVFKEPHVTISTIMQLLGPVLLQPNRDDLGIALHDIRKRLAASSHWVVADMAIYAEVLMDLVTLPAVRAHGCVVAEAYLHLGLLRTCVDDLVPKLLACSGRVIMDMPAVLRCALREPCHQAAAVEAGRGGKRARTEDGPRPDFCRRFDVVEDVSPMADLAVDMVKLCLPTANCETGFFDVVVSSPGMIAFLTEVLKRCYPPEADSNSGTVLALLHCLDSVVARSPQETLRDVFSSGIIPVATDLFAGPYPFAVSAAALRLLRELQDRTGEQLVRPAFDSFHCRATRLIVYSPDLLCLFDHCFRAQGTSAPVVGQLSAAHIAMYEWAMHYPDHDDPMRQLIARLAMDHCRRDGYNGVPGIAGGFDRDHSTPEPFLISFCRFVHMHDDLVALLSEGVQAERVEELIAAMTAMATDLEEDYYLRQFAHQTSLPYLALQVLADVAIPASDANLRLLISAGELLMRSRSFMDDSVRVGLLPVIIDLLSNGAHGSARTMGSQLLLTLLLRPDLSSELHAVAVQPLLLRAMCRSGKAGTDELLGLLMNLSVALDHYPPAKLEQDLQEAEQITGFKMVNVLVRLMHHPHEHTREWASRLHDKLLYIPQEHLHPQAALEVLPTFTPSDPQPCGICMCEDRDEFVRLPCFHMYHSECFTAFASSSATSKCPLCNTHLLDSIGNIMEQCGAE